MKEILYGAAGLLTGLYWLATGAYALLVVRLGWRAFAIFVPFAAIVALAILRLDGKTDRSLADLIEEKCKNKFFKRKMLILMKGGRAVALLISTTFLCPFFTPLVVNSTFKGRKVYFLAVVLNMIGVAGGITFYLCFANWARTVWWLKWIVPNSI